MIEKRKTDSSKQPKKPFAKLSPSTNRLKGMDVAELEISFVDHLEFSLAKDRYSATDRDCYKAISYTTLDRLIERWIATQQTYYHKDVKRAYYISMEYLSGRLLSNALMNLGLYENMTQSLKELGFDLNELREIEEDPGLGNGGLGRLAACFLDSMATLELPAYGYGIRYEYGIFHQSIDNGEQVEMPDHWLRYGSPWEIERPESTYRIQFEGHVEQQTDENGRIRTAWVHTDDVVAVAYDIPVPGFRSNTVNNLRLWGARSSDEFNLSYFNHGDYERAVADQIESETISKILYPRDDFLAGRTLRLKQEYFLVSATVQDILRRFKKTNDDFTHFPDKVAIQLNDTHPALGIPELMRLLLDDEQLSWDTAWDICLRTFGYTNHTVLPEALEKWSVSLLERLLPRHLQLIYEINQRFLDIIATHHPDDPHRQQRMSLIEEGAEKKVRMAHLAMVGSHSINGVAALHTEIIKRDLFRDFHEEFPKKFNNKTNGITQRRWLLLSNPDLAHLITDILGDDWVRDLSVLKQLRSSAEDTEFQQAWRDVKQNNKVHLAEYILEQQGITVNPDSLFDCHIKRIHEYKRQLLNVLHVITLYNRIKEHPKNNYPPRTVIFAGKAAPGYTMAKRIIRLIHAVGETVNNDPDIGDRLKVVFLPDYSVTLAQKIIPATDLSEQTSLAGMEASGTGNMKFALNGALTIGTLDGANIEIMEEVGEDNIFIFGLTADEVTAARKSGYNPQKYYEANAELRQTIDMITSGYFSPENPEVFHSIVRSLLEQGDQYMLLADYADYIKQQDQVNAEYQDPDLWTRKSILNVAHSGKFSSDRTIRQYAEEIWNVQPVSVTLTGVK